MANDGRKSPEPAPAESTFAVLRVIPRRSFASRLLDECLRLSFLNSCITLQLYFFDQWLTWANQYHVRAADVRNGTLGFEEIFVIGLPPGSNQRDDMVLQAAVTDIEINFVNTAREDYFTSSNEPSLSDLEQLDIGASASWSAHIQAMQEIVRSNTSSALIMEHNVDWDVRIKDQLKDLAKATTALVQPLKKKSNSFADPTFASPFEGVLRERKIDLPFHKLPAIEYPSLSPYGDSWDFLWLGHCGMEFPPPRQADIPQGRVVHLDDQTVPQKRYFDSPRNSTNLMNSYPEHTRVVHHVQEGACPLAYAVTQQGARRLLREAALNEPSSSFGTLLASYCEGTNGQRKHVCLTSQPGLFHPRRPTRSVNGQDDVGLHAHEVRGQRHASLVRRSTRLNLDLLLDGGNALIDQCPDSAAA